MSCPKCVAAEDTPEKMARNMMALDEHQKQYILRLQPQRSIPQIILLIGINIGNEEIIQWVLDQYPSLVSKPMTADTEAVVDEVFHDYRHNTPLKKAIASKHDECVKILREHGASEE